MSRHDLLLLGSGIILIFLMLVGVWYVSGVPSLQPTVVDEEVVTMADCPYNTTAYSWIDTNRDGLWDADESPLEGVKVTLDNSNSPDENMAGDSGVTNRAGKAQLHGVSAGCLPVTVYIAAELPVGFEATTPLVYTPDVFREATLYFGFFSTHTRLPVEIPDDLEPIEDCAYEARAKVWVDGNGNGTLDNNERGLEGVGVRLGDASGIRGNMNGDYQVSDGAGRVSLYGWSGGCPPVQLYVAVDVPLGYQATTPLSQTIDIDGTLVPQFGFRRATSNNTPTR